MVTGDEAIVIDAAGKLAAIKGDRMISGLHVAIYQNPYPLSGNIEYLKSYARRMK